MTQAAIRAILVGDATLSALLGTKIFPASVPQETEPPAMVYMLAGVEPTRCKDNSAKLDYQTYTLMAFDTSFDRLQQIGARVRTLLDEYEGTSAGQAIYARFVDESDSYNEQARLHVKNMTYEVEYAF